MPDQIDSTDQLRGLLRDRMTKQSEVQRVRKNIILDTSLAADLRDAEAERDRLQDFIDSHEPDGERRMSQKDALAVAQADLADAEQQVEDLKAQVQAVIVEVRFRSVPSRTYQQLVNDLEPDESTESRFAFMQRLTEEGWVGAFHDGERTGLDWPEIRDNLNYGEEDAINTLVYAANRTVVDLPFSSKPSKRTRHS